MLHYINIMYILSWTDSLAELDTDLPETQRYRFTKQTFFQRFVFSVLKPLSLEET